MNAAREKRKEPKALFTVMKNISIEGKAKEIISPCLLVTLEKWQQKKQLGFFLSRIPCLNSGVG